MYEKIKCNFKNIKVIAINVGYITPYICKILIQDNIIPTIPYKRPMTKKGFFKKYVYDEYYDCYICPNNKVLNYSTINRNGYLEYKSNCNDCKKCNCINNCTSSKINPKIVARHVWEHYLEEANHLRYNPMVNKIYKKRK